MSTSTTTSGALQELYLSLKEHEDNDDDSEDYSTDEDSSKENSEEAIEKRRLVKLIKAAANKNFELLEDFVETLGRLVKVDTLSLSDPDLEPGSI